MKTYRDDAAFYAARGGEFSRESDYGVWWTAGVGFPWWRVSYVRDTGDVYAHRQSPGIGDRVMLLGQVPPVETDDLDVLAAWDKPLDDVLEGWADRCGTAFSLQWVIDRLREYPAKPVDLGNALVALSETLVGDHPELD